MLSIVELYGDHSLEQGVNMLQLAVQDITLNQSPADKLAAIRSIAADLTKKGLVDAGYVEGMLNREAQSSTFLGNGIAIPHGTVETRDLVNKTGVMVHHFKNGVDWGDGNMVYVAIGIAAKSDEHLGILKQLTKVLSADEVEAKLQQATSADDIIALLNGDVQFHVEFNAAHIQLLFPASDMLQLSVVAAALLKNEGCVESDFIVDVIAKEATHLGQGLYLISSDKAVKRTALSFVSCATPLQYKGQEVKGLLTLAACNDCHLPALAKLSELLLKQQQQTLLTASKEQLVQFFSVDSAAETATATDDAMKTSVFKIKNSHGLHARPGAMLVSEAKKFSASIQVANLDGDQRQVNGKSLMKVIGLGVSCGHRLQFVAEGADAEQALAAIGALIAAGLGEG